MERCRRMQLMPRSVSKDDADGTVRTVTTAQKTVDGLNGKAMPLNMCEPGAA
jgi:hypothetical protein